MSDIIDRRPGGGGAKGDSTRYHDEGDGSWSESTASKLRVWDATDGAWNKGTMEHATGGLKVYVAGQAGGGSAVSIADGADVAEGTTSDAAWTSGSGTVIAILKGIFGKFPTLVSGRFPVDASGVAVPVTDNSGSLTVDSPAIPTTAGQKAMSASLGVVLASDQASIPVASTLQTGSAEVGRVGLSKTGTGFAPYFMDAVSTTVKTVSGAAGKFAGLIGVINVNSGPAYLQIFDLAASGSVSLGTTVPTMVIAIPANATAANGVAIVATLDVGIAMANGIQIAATTTAKGNSALGTGLSGTLYYA